MTQEEIEAAIASDPDESGMVVDWSQASIEMPRPKARAQYARRQNFLPPQ
jgi:hypothetical protein